jgi:hypothetical protein
MESLLTQATVVAELFGVGYVASSFAAYAHHRLSHPGTWRSRSTFTPVEDTPKENIPIEGTPPKRKPTPVELLRQQCQKAGIKWRNAHGKNKHLKKAEMIAALQQLEQAKRVTKPQPKGAKPTAQPPMRKRAA